MTRQRMSENHADIGPSRVDIVNTDAEMLAVSTLTNIQHTDAHLLRIDHAPDRDAEQWARAVMEDVPAEVRAALERAWQVIALRLTPGGTDAIAGWSIAHNRPDYVLLQAESALGFEGQLLFQCRQSGLVLATFVQFHDPASRTVWERVLPAHLGFVRSLLEAQIGKLA
ncbi:hypothetical protein [Nocardia arthritidis]|uniref:DUF2867 domain-containing protein n=1 Tax=Nocardia arthritidis TaxID=228602 RepID=A0A6G9YTW4_9NOCA|nr:hypothetical protein [Nocardia arthritidis]QIS16658.1 hypothetical protein F5544_44275 [Nocardia arthritidis]